MAAAWMIPLFAGATGGLLFGYLRFLRWSEEDERRASQGESSAYRIDHLWWDQRPRDEGHGPLLVAESGVA